MASISRALSRLSLTTMSIMRTPPPSTFGRARLCNKQPCCCSAVVSLQQPRRYFSDDGKKKKKGNKKVIKKPDEEDDSATTKSKKEMVELPFDFEDEAVAMDEMEAELVAKVDDTTAATTTTAAIITPEDPLGISKSPFEFPFDDTGKVGGKKDTAAAAITEDPFGVHFEDGKEGLGPELPPIYKRDTTTGRFTGEIEAELTDKDKKSLSADPIERERMLLESVEKHWKKQGPDDSGLPRSLDRLGARIRRSNMALNTLGRSVKSQASAEEMDDGSELGRDKTGFTTNLTMEEFKNFNVYMKDQHKVNVEPEDIPVQENKSARTRSASFAATGEDPDQTALSLKWLSARAQRQMDDSIDDNPYSDLTPQNMSPSRVVNRKHAKQIPVKLLHHNNVELLKYFISETGQIRNRVQTRLGARDQRRVARLIKRARSLGLIPYLGQFKVENHGWIYSQDIGQERKWETQLAERGLTIQRKKAKNDEEKVQAANQFTSSS